ncbi:MAG: pilus assembly FimT family protein [Bacillota bacterium]
MKGMAFDRRGFTLLEIMMTVAVLGIFFGVVYSFLNQNLRFMNERGSEQDYQLQGRIAMARVENFLRKYEKIRISGTDVQTTDEAAPLNLISFAQNTGDIAGYEYYLVWDGSRGAGELRKAGNTVARGIKRFEFVDDGNVIRVTIETVPENKPADPGQVLSTRLRKDRSCSP